MEQKNRMERLKDAWRVLKQISFFSGQTTDKISKLQLSLLHPSSQLRQQRGPLVKLAATHVVFEVT